MINVTFFEIETCRPSQAQTWPRHTLVHIEMPSITSNNRAPAKRLAAILVTTWGFTWQGCRLLKILRPLELENNKVQGLTNNRKTPVHPKWLVSKQLKQNNAKHDKSLQVVPSPIWKRTCSHSPPYASWKCEKDPELHKFYSCSIDGKSGYVNQFLSSLHVLCPLFLQTSEGNSDYSSYFCHYSLLDRNQLTCWSSTHAATARLRKPQWILQPTVDDTLCWSLRRKGDDSCGWKGGKYLPKEWGHIPWEKENLQRCLGRGYRGYVSSQGIHWTQLLQLIFLHNSITARTTRNDNNIRGAMILNQK